MKNRVVVFCRQSVTDNGATEQVIGREGETATLLSRCPLNSGGLGGGFAPRQLRRWALDRGATYDN